VRTSKDTVGDKNIHQTSFWRYVCADIRKRRPQIHSGWSEAANFNAISRRILRFFKQVVVKAFYRTIKHKLYFYAKNFGGFFRKDSAILVDSHASVAM